MPELVHEYQDAQDEDEPAQVQDGMNDAHGKSPCNYKTLDFKPWA
jgi:hypothetical protein